MQLVEQFIVRRSLFVRPCSYSIPHLICCIFPVVGGVAALSGAWILGPRIGRFKYDEESETWISQPIPGHNSVLAATGTFILWFGFFPFNAASGFSIVVSMRL